jgi:sugar lactone lactonase YvrE
MRNSVLAALCLLSCLALADSMNAREMTVTTLAGQHVYRGWYDGIGSEARFARPAGLAMDSQGTLYVSDSFGTIRMISRDGVVSTYIGEPGEYGHQDGVRREARVGYPMGLVYDGKGIIYMAETEHGTVRQIHPGGVVTTFVGRPFHHGTLDGILSSARLNAPAGMAVDEFGNIFVADAEHHVIRKISPHGTVSTLAGKAGEMGHVNGTGSEARFAHPLGVALDSNGNLIVSDGMSQTIRRVTPEGVVTTVAGFPWLPGSLDGHASIARFHGPAGVAVDADDNIYVADHYNHVIRRITPFGAVSTFAGAFGISGGDDGQGAEARFTLPLDVLLDNDGNLVVSSYAVRRITMDGVVTTIAGSEFGLGPDGKRSGARFGSTLEMATDQDGNVYVSDTEYHTIRKVSPSGEVTTIAGAHGQEGHRDGPAHQALFHWPIGLDVDRHGNIYVADFGNHVIRKISAAGEVTTIAGDPGVSGMFDNYITGQFPTIFSTPQYVAVDHHGNVFVTSQWQHSVRKIRPDGRVRTVAGVYNSFGADDGDASLARFSSPAGLAVDAQGNVYVADTGNNAVRRISTSGWVSTYAGRLGEPGSVDGVGWDARFGYLTGLSIDDSGNLYVLDGDVRVVDRSRRVTTMPFGRDRGRMHEAEPDGTGLDVELWATAVATAPDGTLYFAETDWEQSGRIRRAVPAIGDRATIDSEIGSVGKSRRLSVTVRNANEWHWQVVQRPGGSTAQVSDPHSRRARFAPDVAGDYMLRMHAKGPDGERISYVTLSTRHFSSTRVDETSCSLRSGTSALWLGLAAIITAAALRRRRTLSKEQV